jgi:NTE family protein
MCNLHIPFPQLLSMTQSTPKRIALVLGGGGLKGFAHIGVLRALAERGIDPVVIAGTSIGALAAAAFTSGATVDDMAKQALALRRRDLFRINHVGMVLERLRNPAIYLEHPLRALIEAAVPDVQFDDLRRRLLVNTVDLARGTQVVWGLRGLRDVSIRDAVYASCALPGFFPPGLVSGRICVDGGVVDNLPVALAGQGMDAVIAVDVGSTALLPQDDVATQGFAGIYMRAATTMMHELQLRPLHMWGGPPMVLVRPLVAHVDWFEFSRTAELIEAGYTAATQALQQYDAWINSSGGVFPRQAYRLAVNATACIGCGFCVALAPEIMAMTEHGKAVVKEPSVEWSPADGEFVRQCPTGAILAVATSSADGGFPAESNVFEPQKQVTADVSHK